MKSNSALFFTGVTLATVLMFASFANADSEYSDQNIQRPRAAWTCYSQGKQSFGGPVGDIWTTVRGDGATEFQAFDAAQQACFGQGLSMCSPQGCHKNN
jgi:hypothetical protein